MKDSKDVKQKRVRKQAHVTIPAPIDNASFLALLIRSFVFCTLFIVVSIVLIFLFSEWLSSNDLIRIGKHDMSDFSRELSSGKYGSIPTARAFGKNGWFEITDADGAVVYSTRTEPTKQYTLGELDSIQRSDSAYTISSHEFGTVSGTTHYLITRYNEKGETEDYLLLDSGLRVLSGTYATSKTQYTKREFDFLIYNTSHDVQRLFKYVFTGADGRTYNAVFLTEKFGSGYVSQILLAFTIIIVIVLYLGIMAFYIHYINKNVRQPLSTLRNAMTQFAKGGQRDKLEYKGTLEFEQLFGTFNEMVSLLDESENKRAALERDRQRMLAGLSHDLKTPITVIQGFSKAIRDGVVSDEDRQKYLDLILSKTEHMSELISQFYEYSKLNHPDFELHCKKQDIAEAVRAALGYHYDELELRGYRLETDICEEPLYCNLDTQQAIRVMDNLLSNFYKYTAVGSTFYISIFKDGDSAKIIVADNGAGIPKETRDDIFEPFVVGEKARSGQSSGLGLSLCKRIIEKHGGSIVLADSPKEGFATQFEITLPLYNDDEKQD